VENGHRIAKIAGLSHEDLLELTSPRHGAAFAPPPKDAGLAGAVEADYVQLGFRAIIALDARSLDRMLRQSSIHFSHRRVIDGIIVPLLRQVGEAWVNGTLRIAHEHMASAVVRTFLGGLLRDAEDREGGTGIVIATPRGQRHDLGALAVALAASDAGWQPLYLGSNLPAEEIAAAAVHNSARAVAISLVGATDGEQLREECLKLRRLLSDDLPLYAGGQAPVGLRRALKAFGLRWCESLDALHLDLVNGMPPVPERRP
jgi:methanogenic corrinoid protein MtbC1